MSLKFRKVKVARRSPREFTTSLSNVLDSNTRLLSLKEVEKLHTDINIDLIPSMKDADNMKVSSITSLDEDFSVLDSSMSETLLFTARSKVTDSKPQMYGDLPKEMTLKGFPIPMPNVGSTMVSFTNRRTTINPNQVSIAENQMKKDDAELCKKLHHEISNATTQSKSNFRKKIDYISNEFSQLIVECTDLSKRIRKMGKASSLQSLPNDSEFKIYTDPSWRCDADLVQHRKQAREKVDKFRKQINQEQKLQETLLKFCRSDNVWVEDEEDGKLNQIEKILMKKPQPFRIKKNRTRYSQINQRVKMYDLASDMEKLEFAQSQSDDTGSPLNNIYSIERVALSNLDAFEGKQLPSNRSTKVIKNLSKPENCSKYISEKCLRSRTLQNFEIAEHTSCISNEPRMLKPSHKNMPANAKFRLKENERFCSKILVKKDKLGPWDNIPDFTIFKKIRTDSQEKIHN